MNATPIFKGKAAIEPWPEPPWLMEPEEPTGMMVPVAEVATLETWHMIEMRRMIEPEHEITRAELENQPRLPEVPKVLRFELPMRSSEAAVVELEATMQPMELDTSVGRNMAEGAATIASLGRLRRHYQDREDCCQDHDPAHRRPPMERSTTH